MGRAKFLKIQNGQVWRNEAMIRGKLILAIFILLHTPLLAANNPYGVHLLPGSPPEALIWAKSLVGEGGYVKQFFSGISKDTQGPHPGAVAFVRRCYELGLIPICRIGTTFKNGSWTKPEPDAPGDYTSFANGVKRFVEGLPRSDKYPLYIEILNEVNSKVEWSNNPNPEEYAHCLVDCAKAIRSIGDPRIKILNAGMAGGSEFADEMFKAVPESLWAWDVWACHCYGLNRPPEFNKHNGLKDDITIDAYLDDLEVIKKHGRTNVKVMITEAGYQLGEREHLEYPAIDEANRADYIVRSFRDYWSKWPEVLAVTPFQFCDPGWRLHDWVYPDSKTDKYGRPTHAHQQYYDVWNLAKPNMQLGAINGKVRESIFGTELCGATVTLNPGGHKTVTDSHGNYYFPNSYDLQFLQPGDSYTLKVEARGFASQTRTNIAVRAGENTVVNFSLKPIIMGTISGSVKDSSTGKGLPGVKITLSPGNKSGVTDKSGRYTIKGLPPTIYQIKCSKPGYYEYSFPEVQVRAGENSVMNFYLGPGTDLSENLLSNGDMEIGGGLTGVPVSWETPDGNAHPENCAMDSSERFSGKRSLRIEPKGTQWNRLCQWTNYNSIHTGRKYGVECWTKATEGTRAYVHASILTNGSEPVGEIQLSPTKSTPTGWVLYKGSGVAPDFRSEKSGRIRVDIGVDSNSGVAWFDHIWVGEEK
jgi:hypothetical protein